jgi:phage terminase small subunit
MALKPKQQLFLNEYLVDMNATQAAIRAGYSKRSATQIGQRLLLKDDIQAAIKQFLAEKAMKSEEIVQEIADIARGNMGDYLDVSSVAFQINLRNAAEQGKLKNIKRIKQKTTTICREGGEDVEQNQLDFELWDKLKALELLAKMQGLLADKHEIKSGGPVEIIIKRVDAKPADD